MEARIFPIIVVVFLSIVGVAGDVLLKKASQSENQFASIWFMLGFLLYSSTAFGWVFAMKYLKMATVGVIYSVSTILFLAIAGFAIFNERLSLLEILGIVLAIASFILLSRHA